MSDKGMHLVEENEAHTQADVQGLAGWLLALMKGGSLFAGVRGRGERRHMRVVEALPMGPKRNLYLVSCDGERFLVGTGTESVQTIVRVRPEHASAGLGLGGEEAR